MSRNSVVFPQKRITQGTIFCGVRSPYPSLSFCHGICITARCDTARDFKASSLTFLPLVPLESWLWHEALPKAIEDQKKAALGALRKHLLQFVGTTAVLDAFGVNKGFDSADPSKDKGITKQKNAYDEAVLAENLGVYEWGKVPDSIARKVAAEGEQLIAGKIQDFYFIDEIEPLSRSSIDSPSNGFVVLYRDVRAINRNSALHILDGIDHKTLDDLSLNDFTVGQLFADVDNPIYITGELASPFIEQLMQNFSMLFGRIGTKNVPQHYISNLDKLIKGEQ